MLQTQRCLTDTCQKSLLTRIKKITGQSQGLERMIEEGRYCVDILMQISSVHEALRGLSKETMRNYLEQCVTDAFRSDDKETQNAMYRELMDVIYKYAK
ncbi:metal-sensitive transcriptional regulator [candidate division KSB1 bacterium]|nr:metal-sensitive transcriptional regulator [candidate division KSB1 bacterium]